MLGTRTSSASGGLPMLIMLVNETQHGVWWPAITSMHIAAETSGGGVG